MIKVGDNIKIVETGLYNLDSYLGDLVGETGKIIGPYGDDMVLIKFGDRIRFVHKKKEIEILKSKAVPKESGYISKIAVEIAELVEKKNHDYDNSFGKTLKEYGDIAYFLRIEDKLSRLKSLSNKDAKVVDESIQDTLKDIIGYTLLMLNEKSGNCESSFDR